MTDSTLTPAIIAAVATIAAASIAGAVSLGVLAFNSWLTGHRERANRRRDVFSKAFTAAVTYAEFPYVVRRRGSENPEGERIRISTELRAVQQDISYYTAWLNTESKHVSAAYDALIAKLRQVAGSEMNKAWSEPPIDDDTQMNIADFGLGALKPLKQAYLREVGDLLSLWPRWLRRAVRKSE